MLKKIKENRILNTILFTLAIITIPTILIVLLFSLGFNDKYDITTDANKYTEVIGKNSKGQYKDKWGMSEEIFPKTINSLAIQDFKMVYYDPFDKQFLSYLVIDYKEEDYQKELARLKDIGIDNYKGLYSVTGFTNYQLIAMESDSYQGFVYAITDNKQRIIYVELIFCNYYMDIKYEEQIPQEYLPDSFNAKIDNPYQKKMLKINK